MERVTYDITKWFGGKWRVDLRVDGRTVEKSYHSTYADAMRWGENKRADKRQEVGG